MQVLLGALAFLAIGLLEYAYHNRQAMDLTPTQERIERLRKVRARFRGVPSRKVR